LLALCRRDFSIRQYRRYADDSAASAALLKADIKADIVHIGEVPAVDMESKIGAEL
jgi:hypothetical protein